MCVFTNGTAHESSDLQLASTQCNTSISSTKYQSEYMEYLRYAILGIQMTFHLSLWRTFRSPPKELQDALFSTSVKFDFSTSEYNSLEMASLLHQDAIIWRDRIRDSDCATSCMVIQMTRIGVKN